ncbi:MAG: hypothetical protein AB1512_29745 [Thermodesulfobacteriota bacterium]
MKRKAVKARGRATERRNITSPETYALAEKIVRLKEEQRRLGLFCEDRELLSCPCCEIEEDVTFDGFLIVTNLSNPGVDTGLRFSALDEGKGLYRCPGCGKEVVAPKPDFPSR